MWRCRARLVSVLRVGAHVAGRRGLRRARSLVVEFHASEHVGAVDADWRAMREDRDGVQHHITILSRGEVETLSQQRTGAKKIGKEFLSDLLVSHTHSHQRACGLTNACA